VTTPADDRANQGLDSLPEIHEPGRPDGGGEAFDPVIELHQLIQANAMLMNALGHQGVKLDDLHPMITQMINGALLEAILTEMAGEGAVTRVLLTTHQQVADMLNTAESQVAQAKLMAGAHQAPVHNGRVTRPGHMS
jgi:hypothetical protein